MIRWLKLVLQVVFAGLKSRRNLVLEHLALRHQLLVLNRRTNRPRLTPADRALWAWLSQSWADWKRRLCLVQPSTVIQWHRAGFRLFWRWKSRPRKPGRKKMCPKTIELIRQMSRANPLWGAPRIHGGCETKFFLQAASGRVSLRAACWLSLYFQKSSKRRLL